jgi:hypothetical protein
MAWSRRFDDPIPLPDRRKLLTLKDAASYDIALPKAEDKRTTHGLARLSRCE